MRSKVDDRQVRIYGKCLSWKEWIAYNLHTCMFHFELCAFEALFRDSRLIFNAPISCMLAFWTTTHTAWSQNNRNDWQRTRYKKCHALTWLFLWPFYWLNCGILLCPTISWSTSFIIKPPKPSRFHVRSRHRRAILHIYLKQLTNCHQRVSFILSGKGGIPAQRDERGGVREIGPFTQQMDTKTAQMV